MTKTPTNVSTSDANAARIMSGYDAFSRGDIDGALAVFADDILWHVPGRGPLSRDYHGHTEVLGFFKHFMELSNGSFRISWPKTIRSWCYVRKAPSALAEAGLLHRFTSGP